MDFVSPVVLAVGTTHPLNVAGVGLDARIAPLLGVRIVTVVAGVSAQDAGAVLARTPLDEATIGAQFAAVRDAGIGAVHVGALLDARSVSAVAEGLRSLGGVRPCAIRSSPRPAANASPTTRRFARCARCSLRTVRS